MTKSEAYKIIRDFTVKRKNPSLRYNIPPTPRYTSHVSLLPTLNSIPIDDLVYVLADLIIKRKKHRLSDEIPLHKLSEENTRS